MAEWQWLGEQVWRTNQREACSCRVLAAALTPGQVLYQVYINAISGLLVLRMWRHQLRVLHLVHHLAIFSPAQCVSFPMASTSAHWSHSALSRGVIRLETSSDRPRNMSRSTDYFVSEATKSSSQKTKQTTPRHSPQQATFLSPVTTSSFILKTDAVDNKGKSREHAQD